MKVDDEKMGWIQNAGIQNLKSRSANADILRKQANTLLSITLFGGLFSVIFLFRLRMWDWVFLVINHCVNHGDKK